MSTRRTSLFVILRTFALVLLALAAPVSCGNEGPIHPGVVEIQATAVSPQERPLLVSLPPGARAPAPAEGESNAAAGQPAANTAGANAAAERIARRLAEAAERRRRTEDDKSAKAKEDYEKRVKEDVQLVEAETKRLAELDTKVMDTLRSLAFDQAVDMVKAFVATCKSRTVRDQAHIRLVDVEAISSVFATMLASLEPDSEIQLGRSFTAKVVSADRTQVRVKVGSAVTAKKWALMDKEIFLALFDWDDMSADDWYGVGLIAYVLSLDTAAELRFARCAQADPARVARLSSIIVGHRGGAVGTRLQPYKGMWVSTEEQSLIDKGYERYQGKWMSPDDIMKAKGFLLHEGRWVTAKEYERLTRAARKLAELNKKLQPKGLIDKPGADQEKLDWNKRRKYAIKGGHYKIESNLSMDATKDAAYIMEVLHYNFRKIFGVRKTPRYTVKVGKNKNEYDTFMGGGGLGKCSTNGEITTFYQPPNTTMVLMHEGTHQFIFSYSPTCPRHWHEAMASFFECSKFVVNPKTRSLSLATGLLNRWRLGPIQAELRSGNYTPLRDFICGRVQGLRMYHQGWSIVYYFVNAKKGRYARRFFYFIEKHAGKGGMGRKKGQREEKKVLRFMKVMGIWDIDGLEKDWKEFILGLSFKKAQDFNSGHK